MEIDAHQFTPSASTHAKRYSLTLSISCRHPATHCTYWELWVKRTTHHFLQEESGSKCWSTVFQIRLYWHKRRRVLNIKEVLCKWYHFTLSEHLNMPSFSIYEWKLSSVWIYLPEPVFLSSYSIVSITFTNTNHTLIRCAADKMLFAFFLPISLFLESLMVALSHNTKSNLSNI